MVYHNFLPSYFKDGILYLIWESYVYKIAPSRWTKMNKCGCVCVLCLLRHGRNRHYMTETGRLCALAALTPDVLEQNSEPQYCSGCRWQNRNPFILTTKYPVRLIKGAAQLYSPVYRNVFLICDTVLWYLLFILYSTISTWG